MKNHGKPIRIAVDAMGGDFAPGELVSGAIAAARDGVAQIALVGDPDSVERELKKHDVKGLPIICIPSEDVILEIDQPARALRQKPKASILVSMGLVKQKEADACVSMGSTGATMAAASVVLGVMDGIDRPALGGPIVGAAPRTVVLDVGTNVDCTPARLLSFAIIGEVFSSQFYGVSNPRIALLSVGAESGKGNHQVVETTNLLSKSSLNFIGNIEANDLPQGKVDVVVCDGFVGNVVMKLSEGLGGAMAELVRKRLKGRLPESDIEPLANELYEVNNIVETHGGGPLLGVNGVSVIGHGRGKAKSVQRAIETARHAVVTNLITKMSEELKRLRTSDKT